MRLQTLWLLAVFATSVTALTPVARAHEKNEHNVKLSEIPAPARDALTREAKGAPILRVEVEKKQGRTVYEGVIKQGSEEIGIVVDAKGTVLGRHAEKDEDEDERDEH